MIVPRALVFMPTARAIHSPRRVKTGRRRLSSLPDRLEGAPRAARTRQGVVETGPGTTGAAQCGTNRRSGTGRGVVVDVQLLLGCCRGPRSRGRTRHALSTLYRPSPTDRAGRDHGTGAPLGAPGPLLDGPVAFSSMNETSSSRVWNRSAMGAAVSDMGVPRRVRMRVRFGRRASVSLALSSGKETCLRNYASAPPSRPARGQCLRSLSLTSPCGRPTSAPAGSRHRHGRVFQGSHRVAHRAWPPAAGRHQAPLVWQEPH